MWFLCTRAPIEFKSAHAYSRLLEVCRLHASNTVLIPVTDLQQLMISEKGVTPSQYRWEFMAFQQLCNSLAGGLFAALSTLWKVGEHLPVDDRRKTLLRTYHNALKLGIKEVTGTKLVVDKSDKTIVGVVGRTYKYVSNFDLLSMLSRNFGDRGNYVSGYSSIRNRDICLLGICRDVSRHANGVVFRQGVGVFNSETTRQAIYVPRLVYDSVTRSYSVEPANPDNRLIHRSKKGFAQSLDSVVSSAFVSKDNLDDVIAGFSRLTKTALWTGGESKAKVLRELIAGLDSIEVGVLAQNAVRSALEGMGTATLWDFYQSLALTAVAGRSDRTLRTCAFKLLVSGSLK